MFRNLWAVTIRMQLAKPFLIPVLSYGSEIFTNCDTDDRRKLNLAYYNIARYVFIKGRRGHISQFSYRIFEINFDNLLNIKWLILLHKIITQEQTIYLFPRIRLTRSNRGKKIIQYRLRTLLSQRQFFAIHYLIIFRTQAM